MNQTKATTPSRIVAEQADYWLTLLKSPLASDQQRQAFQQWLAEASEHRLAFAKAQAFWQKLDGLDNEQIERLEGALSTKTVVLPKVRRTLSFNGFWLFPAMACLLLLVSVGFNAWPRYAADYRTGVGEMQTVRLSDGSTVILNTDSYLSVDYSENHRTLTLYGEAYFNVAADPTRPFNVITDVGDVRALGTAFDVKAIDGGMDVSVFQHAVRVSFEQGEIIEKLDEGERVALKNDHTVSFGQADLKQVRAWREQRLVFVDSPLNQVIAELDRYRSGKIVILDQALAEHRVTGVFDPRDTDAALNAIEKTLNIKQFRLTKHWVFLSLSR